MAKDYGPNVTGFLDPDLRAYETTVYQQSKPVLDKELNLIQDLAQFKSRQTRTGVPSGWLSAGVLDSSVTDDIFTASAVANELEFPALTALVNDWQVLVRHTNETTTSNKINLGAGPAGVGAKRTDLVFLEVWRILLSASPDTDGKSAAGRIWRNGNVKIDSSDDVALNPADDILEALVGSETTKRVQIQYRVRVFSGVDLDSYPQGLDDPLLFANTVPTNAVTPDGAATLFNYTNQSANGDAGLWVAGDGNPANSLGTVDGYIYAIPLCAVFRRNTNAFDQDVNMNGGVASPGPSDRPDGLFHDIIASRDVLDLRFHISRSGWDLQELLSKNTNYVFDNALQTEQATFPQAGGQVGHTSLWADEIGPVDNPGPALIRNFDSISRRFSDRATLETVWVRYTPADQTTPGATWNGSPILIEPNNLPVYPYPNFNLSSVAPSNISIVSVLGYFQNGANGNAWAGRFGDPDGGTGASAPFDAIFQGIGAVPAGTITTEASTAQQNGGTGNSDIYYLLLISYPAGQGLTKTPVDDYSAASFVNETPANLPAGSPYYYDTMEVQEFDYPHREVQLEYRTLDHVFTARPKALSGDMLLFVPDRIASVTSIALNGGGSTYTGGVQVFDDGYGVIISDAPGDWTGAVPNFSGNMVDITYQARRPIPNNNVQFTLWYETRAPQTIRSDLLGTTLQVIPRYVSPHLYCLTVGSGSQGEAYPFPQQYVQSPGVYPGSGGTFNGDHDLDGTGQVSIADFQAETGFIQVPTFVPAVPNPQTLTFERLGGDIDAEGRSYFKEVPAGYIPAAFGQPMSDPVKHKNCLPMICELAADGPIGPQGSLVLVMLARWADFDAENKVAFDSDLSANYTSASVYRLKGNPLANRRV